MIYVLTASTGHYDERSNWIVGYNANKNVLSKQIEKLTQDHINKQNLIEKFKTVYHYSFPQLMTPIKKKGIKIPDRGNTSPEHFHKICKLINDENMKLVQEHQKAMDEYNKQAQINVQAHMDFNIQFIKDHPEFLPLYDETNKSFNFFYSELPDYDIEEIFEIVP